MSTILIPTTLEESRRRLEQLDEIYRSKGWERAAILAGIVRLPGSGANPGSRVYTAEQLARERISGLRDPDTIRKYVQRWLDANDGVYPVPGHKVTLPAAPWPPVDKADGGGRVSTDPAKAVTQVIDKHGIAATAAPMLTMAVAAPEQLAAALDEMSDHDVVTLELAAQKRLPKPPKPPKPPVDEDAEFWHKVEAALHLVVEAQVRVSNGIEPPAGVAMLMGIVLPRQDWDDALAQLVGDER